MCDGIENELERIDLGDLRLNRRSKQVLRALAAKSEDSINLACETRADTVAADRLFNNPGVMPEKTLEPHRQATVARICQEPVVLVVQDTTELDFTTHPAVDVRHLNNEHRRGLYLHDHVASGPTGFA